MKCDAFLLNSMNFHSFHNITRLFAPLSVDSNVFLSLMLVSMTTTTTTTTTTIHIFTDFSPKHFLYLLTYMFFGNSSLCCVHFIFHVMSVVALSFSLCCRANLYIPSTMLLCYAFLANFKWNGNSSNKHTATTEKSKKCRV